MEENVSDSQIKKNQNFKENFVSSETYDEIKFIDDWISFLENVKINSKSESKYDDSQPFIESNGLPCFKVEDESSYSSVMDLYLNTEKKYHYSDESNDTLSCNHLGRNSLNEENKSIDKSFEHIDLSKKPNIANVNINSSSNSLNSLLTNHEEQEFDKNDKKDSNKKISHEKVNLYKRSWERDSVIPLKLKNSFSSGDSSKKSSKNLKVNTINIDANIYVSKKNQNKNVSGRDTLKIKRDKVQLGENGAYDDIKTESSGDIYDVGQMPQIKTLGLLREAEKRTIQQNRRSEFDVPLRRFVIETEEVVIQINDLYKLNDLKNKTLLGRLFKRGNNGYYQKNLFCLRENFFTCYNGKKNKITSISIPNERNGDIEDPDDPQVYYTKKYSLDILSSRFYLCKQKGKKDIFTCFSESIPAESDLIDITHMSIISLVENILGYQIVLKRGDEHAEITLSCLNFGIKNNDGYRFYKVETIEEFLKWMIAFKFRLGQISLNIG